MRLLSSLRFITNRPGLPDGVVPVPVPCNDWPVCADTDGELAFSELEGRLARTTARLEQLATELEARHVRYAWTEQLAADLRAIAHGTPADTPR